MPVRRAPQTRSAAGGGRRVTPRTIGLTDGAGQARFRRAAVLRAEAGSDTGAAVARSNLRQHSGNSQHSLVSIGPVRTGGPYQSQIPASKPANPQTFPGNGRESQLDP